MVNNRFTPDERAVVERRMILSYSPSNARAGLAALLALDDLLGGVVAKAREPMIGQMRLTWWHGALTALDTAPPPAEPVLQALARDVLARVPGSARAGQGEGWEELLDPEPPDDARLHAFAEHRGAALFHAAGAMLGAAPDDPLAPAGRGWALADLSVRSEAAATRARAAELASDLLAQTAGRRWSRQARALGAMMHLARMPINAGASRVGRSLWHRLTGR